MAAWKLAILANPPRSRVEQDIADDVMRFNEDAWHGRRPKLAHFNIGLFGMVVPDGSGPARVASAHGALEPARAA